MEKIKEEVRKNQEQSISDDQKSNKYEPLENLHTYIHDIPNKNKGKIETDPIFVKRIKKSAGIVMGVVIVGMIIYGMTDSSSSGIDTSDEAAKALKTHMSTTLGAGTILLDTDEKYMGKDFTITHKSALNEATIDIWDYAAEDGDYVQIFADGTPLGDPFMIKNKPVSVKVPTVGEIQVVGTRDGGGGITYGVYYHINSTTYFNGMNKGESNTYTLIRK